MNLPVLGLLSELRGEIIELARNLLIVLGGFLLGYLFGGLIGWATGRWVFRLKNLEVARKVGRPVGGTLAAIIVALIVFTGKGQSPGEGGDGKGGVTGPDSKSGTPQASRPETSPRVEPKVSTSADQKLTNTIRVTVLGGDAVKVMGNFYVIDDDSWDQARSLSQLKKIVEERQKQSPGKTYIEILFPANRKDTVPREHRNVTDIENWADSAGVGVIFPSSR